MSLILEALKKSETRRRLGEAPDIGTPFTVKPRRRSPWPLIVILIAAAAGVGWWYVHAPPQPKDANTIVALTSPPAPPSTGKNPANASQAATPGTKAGPAPAARDPASVQAQLRTDATIAGPTTKPPGRAEGGMAATTAPVGTQELRTPRPVNQHLPLTAAPAPALATAGSNAPVAPGSAAQQPASRAPLPPVLAASAPATALAEPANHAGAAVPVPVPQPNVAPAPPVGAPPKPAEPVAAATAVPQYYELAYGVRKDIPQFNLSMHVFAADPAARFIVVDGERKAEGDTVKEGLVLREVRIDGVVLEYRGQRFFYPRPGH